MGTGVAFHELALIAEMLNEEHRLVGCMRDSGEAPQPEAEARCYAGAIAQINLLVPILQMAALDMERVNSWVA